MNRKRTGSDVLKYTAKDRWFTIAKIILAISPFVFLAFLGLTAGGQDFQKMLTDNPEVTVAFLAAMTGPFAAYLLGFVQNKLHDGDEGYAVVNLMLMMISEAMLWNTLYFIMMIILMVFVAGMTGVNPLQAIKDKWHDHFWRDISGSLVLMGISAICLFASVRLGMR